MAGWIGLRGRCVRSSGGEAEVAGGGLREAVGETRMSPRPAPLHSLDMNTAVDGAADITVTETVRPNDEANELHACARRHLLMGHSTQKLFYRSCISV